MYIDDWEMLSVQLVNYMVNVWWVFNELIGDDEVQLLDEQLVEYWCELWQDVLEEDDVSLVLVYLNDVDCCSVLVLIVDFCKELDWCIIGLCGCQVLDQLMLYLLSEICLCVDVLLFLVWIMLLLIGIVICIIYFELLSEFFGVLKYLIMFCVVLLMVVSQLVCYLLLLDELLDFNIFYQLMVIDVYCDELCQYLLWVLEEDEEQQLEVLCQFKQVQQLYIVVVDIVGILLVMKVSDYLIWFVEVIFDVVVQQVWGQMVVCYGLLIYLYDCQGCGFVVVGYGKFGGWELGYSFDFDLVFFYDCLVEVMIDGEWEIDGCQFYLWLVQWIMYLFSICILFGIFYEVDVWLCFFGVVGMLVIIVDVFVDYQQNEVWMWEYQVLVCVCVVYGDLVLQVCFDVICCDILIILWEGVILQIEVCEMCEKMCVYFGNKYFNCFDIKVDVGGIMDIEFIIQYLVLCYVSDKLKLICWFDNVCIFELLVQNDIMDEEEVCVLMYVYIILCDVFYYLVLQELLGYVVLEVFSWECEQVSVSWQKWLMV